MTQFKMLFESLSCISHMHKISDQKMLRCTVKVLLHSNRFIKPNQERNQNPNPILILLLQAVVSGLCKWQWSLLEEIGHSIRQHILEGQHRGGRLGDDRDMVEEAEPEMLAYLDVPQFDLFEAQFPPSAVDGGFGGGVGRVLEFMCSPAHVDLIECLLFVISE